VTVLERDVALINAGLSAAIVQAIIEVYPALIAADVCSDVILY